MKLPPTLRYAVRVSNAGPANCVLYSAMVSDPLPEGLELAPGTISLSLPGGRTLPVGDSAGDLWGGERAELSFECTVREAAVDGRNANVAYAHGTLPSADPDRDPQAPPEGEEPDSPAVTPEGGLVIPSNASEAPVAESDPVLPPGVEPGGEPEPPAGGGDGPSPLPPAGGGSSQRPPAGGAAGALRDLPTTGDPLSAAALSLAAAALLAGSAALAARRRRRG